MAFGLSPGKLGFKLGDVLVGLADGTEDTPEAIKTTAGRAQFIPYQWNPSTLAYEPVTPAGAVTPQSVRIVAASATVKYIGWAAAGSSESGAVWRIMRLTSSGDNLTVEWADGDTDYDNVFDDREALTYA